MPHKWLCMIPRYIIFSFPILRCLTPWFISLFKPIDRFIFFFLASAISIYWFLLSTLYVNWLCLSRVLEYILRCCSFSNFNLRAIFKCLIYHLECTLYAYKMIQMNLWETHIIRVIRTFQFDVFIRSYAYVRNKKFELPFFCKVRSHHQLTVCFRSSIQ